MEKPYTRQKISHEANREPKVVLQTHITFHNIVIKKTLHTPQIIYYLLFYF